MKVTILYPRALSEPQGLSQVVKTFANSRHLFLEKGIDLTVLSRETIMGHPISYENGMQIFRSRYISIIRKLLLRILNWGASHFTAITKILVERAYRSWSKKIVDYYIHNRYQSDILMFHDFFTCYEYLQKCGKGTKTICLIHSLGIPLHGFKIDYPHIIGTSFYKYLSHMDKYVYENVSAYGFVSRKSVSNFIEAVPDYDTNKLFYVHNGIPNKIYTKKTKSSIVNIVCVAGINKYKGQERIVDAIIEVSNTRNDLHKFHFTFLGTGDLFHHLSNKVRSAGVDELFSFIGQVNNVDDYLRDSDIFILPTSNDGLPMAIIEAMRASLPIVSTDVGGISELVDNGVTGLLIEPSKEGVISFIQNYDIYDWKKMGVMSRLKYEREFTVEAMVNKYCELINKVNNNE